MTFAENKLALVDAHRRGDWETAARLSQERQKLKKQSRRHCVDCGKRVAHATRCAPCNQLHRFYGRTLAALFLIVALVGCASRPGAPFPALPEPKPLTTAERDALFYHWPAPAPVLARGSVTDQAINPQPSTINLAWYQPGTCMGWRIETSNDLRTWTTNKTLWCEYIFRDRSITTTVAVTSPAFFRVAAFNEKGQQ